MRGLRDESGQVMVLTVLCMAVLLGFVAFAVDVGILLYVKREMQTAADSAAIAGASEISLGDSDPADITAAARADASQNGVTDGAKGATVSVNPSYGGAKYGGVEVTVSEPQPTFFMKIANQGSIVVSASAVATLVPSTTCIYTLSSAPVSGVMVGSSTSSGTLALPSCGILDDAAGGTALSVVAGSISARSIGVVGGVSDNGTITPNPITGVAPFGDPLSSLAPPAFDPASCLPNPNVNANQTLGPSAPGGTVCYNGLTVNSGTLTLNPGVYVINGSGISLFSGALSGTGVTFYLANSANYTSYSGTTINLTAPTTGAYNGILFYEDPSDTQTMTWIGNSGTLNGIFYLPAAQLQLLLANAGSMNLNISIVVGSLSVSGGATINNFVPLNGPSPLLTPVLAE